MLKGEKSNFFNDTAELSSDGIFTLALEVVDCINTVPTKNQANLVLDKAKEIISMKFDK